MLRHFCTFLSGLGNVDEGCESTLSPKAYAGLLLMTADVYGSEASAQLEKLFTFKNGGHVMTVENPEDFFRPWA